MQVTHYYFAIWYSKVDQGLYQNNAWANKSELFRIVFEWLLSPRTNPCATHPQPDGNTRSSSTEMRTRTAQPKPQKIWCVPGFGNFASPQRNLPSHFHTGSRKFWTNIKLVYMHPLSGVLYCVLQLTDPRTNFMFPNAATGLFALVAKKALSTTKLSGSRLFKLANVQGPHDLKKRILVAQPKFQQREMRRMFEHEKEEAIWNSHPSPRNIFAIRVLWGAPPLERSCNSVETLIRTVCDAYNRFEENTH